MAATVEANGTLAQQAVPEGCSAAGTRRHGRSESGRDQDRQANADNQPAAIDSGGYRKAQGGATQQQDKRIKKQKTCWAETVKSAQQAAPKDQTISIGRRDG
jgi:hypothetical protein